MGKNIRINRHDGSQTLERFRSQVDQIRSHCDNKSIENWPKGVLQSSAPRDGHTSSMGMTQGVWVTSM